jgi:hypothetical protein
MLSNPNPVKRRCGIRDSDRKKTAKETSHDDA